MSSIPPPTDTHTPGADRSPRSSLGYIPGLCALVAVAAAYGLVTDDAYRLVRPLMSGPHGAHRTRSR